MNEELDMVSMQILLHAGNARAFLKESLDLVAAGNIAQAEAKIAEAQKEQTQAHVQQTDIIQGTADGKTVEYSLLFSHAQDTLMTIASELLLAKQLIKIYSALDARIATLEKK